MKKIGILFISIILMVNGIQIIGADDYNIDETSSITFTKLFEPLTIQNEGIFSILELNTKNTFINEPGHPKLPVYHKIFSIPGEIKISEINCYFSEPTYQKIEQKIKPVEQTRYKINTNKEINTLVYLENEEIYNNDQFYPEKTYDYKIRCGLNFEGRPTTFIIFDIYPIRYNPVDQLLSFSSEVEIQVKYEEKPKVSLHTSANTFDLVIIAPNEFTNDLQPLIEHKNSMGLSTILKTVEEIYNEYPGRDEPEQIKYFIKDAKETWGTSYILLIGGLNSYLYAKDRDGHSHGANAWHVPVRYTNIHEGSEIGCISDLYYGDLYRYNEELGEWEFEDWDSNGDGIFARWSFINNDELDLIPDIYVGRLPCRNTFELSIVRDKIIQYESTSPQEKPWYNKIIGITGKNFDMWQGQPDGEYLVDRAIENMSSIADEVVRIYASNVQSGNGPIPNNEDIIEEFSKGAGFIDFEGHGNPIVWNTIHADGEYEDHEWVGGIRIDDFLQLSNGDKLPVVMVGGCHNGLYNVTILRILLTRRDNEFYWTWTPTPLCFCWAMVVKPNGGAIASIGATGLGPASGSDPISLQGEIDLDFFYVIGQQHVEKLGEGHSGAITKYVTDNKMRQREVFTTTITQLFGDPSLQLGGYS